VLCANLACGTNIRTFCEEQSPCNTGGNGRGSRDLVALFTIITGLIGMISGDLVLTFLRLRSPVAGGASFGASAHGFGTARARQRGTEDGVVASLTMVLAGVMMVVVGPALTNFISRVPGG
jgi:putative effector of murein hydrolase